MAGTFDSINENNKLFRKLANASSRPDWWNVLVADKDLVFEIRKDNYIDIYYRGGAIVRMLKYNGEKWSGKIHIAYVPYGDKSLYVQYQLDSGEPKFAPHNYLGMHDCFKKQSLKKIKERIRQYFPDGSEKALQSQFILSHASFLDSEFAYSTGQKKSKALQIEDEDICISSSQAVPGLIRIDLIKVALKKKKIVFVELKRSGDSRLNDGIVKQLSEYQQFVEKNKDALACYYKKIFELKRKLDILPVDLKNGDISDFTVETRPVLLIVKETPNGWTNEADEKLRSEIKDFADIQVVNGPDDRLGSFLE